MHSEFIFLYGPPASGKSAVGSLLAKELELPFYDLDSEIELQADRIIPEIFAEEGESGFRLRESKVLRQLLKRPAGVVSLGGGSLLEPGNRSVVEGNGQIVCLTASINTILERLNLSGNGRPLLDGNQQGKLEQLLIEREGHYKSFKHQLQNDGQTPAEAAWLIQVDLGRFFAKGMGQGYPVEVLSGGLDRLGEMIQPFKPDGANILVSDENVADHYKSRALSWLRLAGYRFESVVLPPGEQNKSLGTVELLLDRFTKAGMDRHSLVVSMGGGVVGDLAGFTAAIYLRGVRWAAVPTSLLSMVDASLGGKTGADLPQGKNLVGAFHPPEMVLVDPEMLTTLPDVEFINGMAEVVKHGVIGDRELFDQCCQGLHAVHADIIRLVRRAVAVKLRVIQADPFEKGQRASLNLGHTLGHALEAVSGYQIKHGEGVAIGMAAAARLSEQVGIAQKGLAAELESCLLSLGLPVRIPGNLDRSRLSAAMLFDKKRLHGRQRLVLPVRIGEVRWGVEIDDPASLLEVME